MRFGYLVFILFCFFHEQTILNEREERVGGGEDGEVSVGGGEDGEVRVGEVGVEEEGDVRFTGAQHIVGHAVLERGQGVLGGGGLDVLGGARALERALALRG